MPALVANRRLFSDLRSEPGTSSSGLHAMLQVDWQSSNQPFVKSKSSSDRCSPQKWAEVPDMMRKDLALSSLDPLMLESSIFSNVLLDLGELLLHRFALLSRGT